MNAVDAAALRKLALSWRWWATQCTDNRPERIAWTAAAGELEKLAGLPTPTVEEIDACVDAPEVPTQEVFTVRLPGTADQILRDSGYRNDCPAIWERYLENRELRSVGRGYVAIVTLSREDWSDILEHMESVVDVQSTMTSAELGDGGWTELKAARVAVRRITEALGSENGTA